MSSAAKWIDLEIIILSEESQTKDWDHLYVESIFFNDFPSSPVVRTLHFHYGGARVHLWLGIWDLVCFTAWQIFFILNRNKCYKWTYLQNRNRLTEFENKLMVTKGGGGMNQEPRINIHMLLYRRQITGSSPQYSCNNCMGERLWKRVDMCITNSHCSMPRPRVSSGLEPSFPLCPSSAPIPASPITMATSQLQLTPQLSAAHSFWSSYSPLHLKKEGTGCPMGLLPHTPPPEVRRHD